MDKPIKELLTPKEIENLKGLDDPIPLDTKFYALTVSDLFCFGYYVIEDNSVVGVSLGIKALMVLHKRSLEKETLVDGEGLE